MSQTGTAPPSSTRRSGEASSSETSGSDTAGEGESQGALVNGFSVDSLSVPADADPEEAAAIVAAVTEHLRAQEQAAADAEEESSEADLWTFSVRMDRPPQTPVATADVPTDPWVAAGRMR